MDAQPDLFTVNVVSDTNICVVVVIF